MIMESRPQLHTHRYISEPESPDSSANSSANSNADPPIIGVWVRALPFVAPCYASSDLDILIYSYYDIRKYAS